MYSEADFLDISERNGIYTRETACVFLEGSSANQFQPAIFAARIGALVSLLMSSAKRDGLT